MKRINFFPAWGPYIDPVDIEYLYLFSIIWSLGAALIGTARYKLDSFLKKLSREPLPDGTLYDHFYDVASRRWEKWQTLVPSGRGSLDNFFKKESSLHLAVPIKAAPRDHIIENKYRYGETIMFRD